MNGERTAQREHPAEGMAAPRLGPVRERPALPPLVKPLFQLTTEADARAEAFIGSAGPATYPAPAAGALPRWQALLAMGLQLLRDNQAAAKALGDQAVVSATNFLTSIIIGRACSRDQFGLYVLAFYVIIGATEIQTSLISAPYTVFRPRLAKAEVRGFNGSVLLVQVAFSLVAMGVLLAAAGLLGPQRGLAGLGPVLAALGATVGCTLLKEHARRMAFASLRMGSALALDGAVGLLQVTLLLALVGTHRLSAVTGVLAVSAAAGVAVAGWLLANRHEWTVARSKVTEVARSIWGLGRWMSASGILSHLTAQLFPWLIASLDGSGSTAVWAACGSITSVVNPAILGLANYMTPAAATAFVAGGSQRLRRLITRTSLLYAAALAPFCLTLLVAGEFVVTFLYGRAYSGTGVLVALLTFNLIPTGLSVVCSRGLYAIHRADVDFKINLLPLFATIAAGLWLIKPWGVVGAGAAALAGNSVAAAARYWAFGLLSPKAEPGTASGAGASGATATEP